MSSSRALALNAAGRTSVYFNSPRVARSRSSSDIPAVPTSAARIGWRPTAVHHHPLGALGVRLDVPDSLPVPLRGVLLHLGRMLEHVPVGVDEAKSRRGIRRASWSHDAPLSRPRPIAELLVRRTI